ncbi:MAG: BON domain-containing protein [Acidobacteria bacterium]|nr:BON domain-containing protein [Acidobacteriota bacterium]
MVKRYVSLLAVLLLVAASVGCSSQPNDMQITSEVQSKLFADPNITGKQIYVSTQSGVVTLAGTVPSEMERAAAGNDASQVKGVKTVVNNLQVAPPVVAAVEPEPEKPAPVVATRRGPVRRAAARTSAPAPVYTPAPAAPAAAPVVAAKPAPPPPVTIQAGTRVSIRTMDPIDTSKNQLGDTFRATLESPLMVGDKVVVPEGTEVEGRIAELKSAGRFAGRSELAIELSELIINGKSYPIETDQFTRQGSSRGKATAAKVGGGAAIGAIIGGIAGGGKGAAIGATVGAGAGTGVSAATKGQQIKIPSETVLTFNLQRPVTVTATSSVRRGDEPYLSRRPAAEEPEEEPE